MLFKTKPHVLLLDDDPSMQKLVAMLLRRAGYRVDVVSDGAQAIENIGHTDYAALLLDLMTQTEGGLTVIRHLKESQPELLKRVILVTGSTESVIRTVAKDIATVVHKPFEAAQLVETVNRVVSGK